MIASSLYNAPPTEKTYPIVKHRFLLVLPNGEERETITGFVSDIADAVYAGNDREAIRLLETHPPKLVIAHATDESYGLCWYIKQHFRFSDIPVIELIPRGSFTTRLRCLESGVDACVEKPVSQHLLLAQIGNLLANRTRIREHLLASTAPGYSPDTSQARVDETLWKRVNQVIGEHLSDAGLDTDFLARRLYISRPTLYRKIAEMSSMTPSELITVTRLDHAAALLRTPGYSIGDIVRLSGFATRSGFGKAFQKRFGVTPTEYRLKITTTR